MRRFLSLLALVLVVAVYFAAGDYGYTTIVDVSVGGDIGAAVLMDAYDTQYDSFTGIGVGLGFSKVLWRDFTFDLYARGWKGYRLGESLFEITEAPGFGYFMGVGLGKGYELRALRDVAEVLGVAHTTLGIGIFREPLYEDLKTSFGITEESNWALFLKTMNVSENAIFEVFGLFAFQLDSETKKVSYYLKASFNLGFGLIQKAEEQE